jgi:hypothetical protein
MTARVLPITVFVSVDDVVAALGCSRSTAYEHLRRAARREAGARGLLRVPVAVWEDYLRETNGAPRLSGRSCAPAAPAVAGVYFVQHDTNGPIKIGHAGDIALRLRLLQTGNPYPLRLLGYIATANGGAYERSWHERFRSFRLGGEWFTPAAALLSAITVETRPWP